MCGQLQENAGWVAVNVVVPVALPFLVIAAVAAATDGWPMFVKMLRKSVDLGQLYWVVLSMLASASYEAFVAYGREPKENEFISWTLGTCVFTVFVSAIFIAANTIQAAHRRPVRRVVIWISMLLTSAISIYYPWLHMKLAQC